MSAGILRYPCHQSPGMVVALDICAYADHYTASVTLNGVRTRTARRRTLADAVRWGRRVSEDTVALLGASPAQLAFG